MLQNRNERTALIRVNVDYMKKKGIEARDLEMTHIFDRVDDLGEEFNFILSSLESRINETTADVEHMAANVKNYSGQFEELKDSLTYQDCTSIKEENSLSFSGVYNLSLPRVGHVSARCKMDNKGKGWTVLLRRSDHMNPHQDFDKGKRLFVQCSMRL